MGDSACLMHGFSYASAIPNESKQGNPMHALGESVSFGRFMTEPLSWEKWSTFSSHKKYVEEAASYAQKGSVAQKKAFFEAHYKRIAAQKAAALLEQENAAKAAAEGVSDHINHDIEQESVVFGSHLDDNEKTGEFKIQEPKEDGLVLNYNENVSVDAAEIGKVGENAEAKGNECLEECPVKGNSVNKTENLDTISSSESSGTPQIERPLLKNCVASEDIASVTSKNRLGLSSLRSSIQRRTWKVPSTPLKPVTPQFKKDNNVPESARKSSVDSAERKRSSPKSLRTLMSLIANKEPVFAAKKTETTGLLRNSSRTTKDCATPLRTPIVAAAKGVSKYPAATPLSENRRMKTPSGPSGAGSKTTGPRWHILSAVCNKSLSACRNKLQSPTISTPFILRTEERAAKRKQPRDFETYFSRLHQCILNMKLEEKFNANEVQKVNPQRTLKEKAGNEFRKLSQSLCFKARPLPDFYKEKEPPKIRPKKAPAAKTQTAVLGRSNSYKKQGTISMPPPPPPPSSSFTKNRISKNLPKKSFSNPSKFLSASSPGRITHENKSPNILQ